MLYHMEQVAVTVVLYETWKFSRVRITTREDKGGNFALHAEEEKILKAC